MCVGNSLCHDRVEIIVVLSGLHRCIWGMHRIARTSLVLCAGPFVVGLCQTRMGWQGLVENIEVTFKILRCYIHHGQDATDGVATPQTKFILTRIGTH